MPLGIRRCWGMALAVFIWCSPATAQEGHRNERWLPLADSVFQNFNQNQRLPSTLYNAITEDSDGFLWFGGGKALFRWDGYRFRGYEAVPGDPHALHDNYVLCLYRDSQGRLWVGTSAGGLARYDKESDGFVTIDAGPEGLANGTVDAIADDGAGGLWVGTEGGLDHLDQNGKVSHWHHRDDDAASLPDDRITRLWRDKSGRLWIGTRAGLACLDPGGTSFVRISLPPPGNPNPTIWALLGDESGRLWIGTLGQGAYVLEPGKVEPHSVDVSSLATESVSALVEAEQGILWIGTHGQGIAELDVATGKVRRMRHDPSRPSSIADNTVHTLYRDRTGSIWAGVTGTVSRVDPAEKALLTLFGETGHKDGISDSEVWSLLPTANGYVWTGLRTLGIDILDPETGRWVGALRPDPAHPQSALPEAPVYAMASAENGAIYIGTLRGLYRTDQAGKKVGRLTVNPENPQMGVRTLAVSGRTLWIGCTGNGLWRFDLNSEKPVAHYGLDKLGDARVETITPAKDGLLWVGTQNGLVIFDPGRETVERILPDTKDLESLPAKWISAVLFDSRGRQWIGTLGGGIGLFTGRDEKGRPRFRHVGAEAGLAHAIIGSLFEDKLGQIWASSDEGLSIIEPDNFGIRTLQRAEGATLPLYRVGSGTTTAAGELLFGGVGGVIVARPDLVKPWGYRPPLVISDLRIGGHSVPPGREQKLSLTPDTNSFEAEFAALDFSAPERNHYAYRLKGFDKEWIPSDSSRRLAVYTNLPPGNFTFHVRASNRDGEWMDTTLDLPIHVKPAWYQTIWFYLGLTLAGAGAVTALVRSRTAYLRSRQKRLEQLVVDRTASLAEANAALGRRTDQLERKTQQVTDLLDNSGEGFFSFDASLLVGNEYSRACETMLRGSPAGKQVDQVLLPYDPQRAETFRQIITTAIETPASWKRSLMLSLLPNELDRGTLRLRAEYKDLGGNRIMVVLSDVTEEQRLAAKVVSEHRHLAMTVSAVTESRDFFDLLGAIRRFWSVELVGFLASSATPPTILQDVYRSIHTFKGSLNQFHFLEAPNILHELETDLSNLRFRGDDLEISEISSLTATIDWETLLDTDLTPLRQILGEEFFAEGSQLKLSTERASQMLVAAESLLDLGLPAPAQANLERLVADLRELNHLNLAVAIAAFERVVLQTAKQLEKMVAPLVIAGDTDIWIEPERYSSFLRSLTHVFRNAIAHGIETPEERLRAGKPMEGTITILIENGTEEIRLTISDNGAGVNIETLREKAVELDLYQPAEAEALSEAELIELMFADAVSTQETADEIAGRGVGLAAVRAEVMALGGTVAVQMQRGAGTSFVFILPHDGVKRQSAHKMESAHA